MKYTSTVYNSKLVSCVEHRKNLEITSHRIIEQPMLEGTTKDHLIQPFVGKRASMRLSSTLPNCILETSSGRHSTMSLGRLFHWLITLIVKNFCLISRWNISGAACTHCPLSSCGFLWRESLHLLCSCPLSTGVLWWGPLETFLLHGAKTKPLQSFLVGQVFQPFDYLCGLPLKPFWSACVFVELWGPELDIVLQVWPNECGVEWEDHVPISASEPDNKSSFVRMQEDWEEIRFLCIYPIC